ncbi:MAG TPA: helix-turn-helix domain-containing protein [Polyangiaceae bacterium]|nr:helix-turn-helix domain-containing protein [Polyangiaceae bacterium]
MTRRTQADRKATTRRALLDATIQSLVELGYANTTTSEIVARAGVSQGALFKHFATKEALLSAAAEELCSSLFPKFRRAMRTHRSGKDALERAIRGLWSVFETAEVRVLHELYAAAPTEPALRDALSPIVAKHHKHILYEARSLFPDLAELVHFERAVEIVVAAMQGAAMMLFTGRNNSRERTLLEGLAFLIRAAPAALSAPQAPKR